ncbi:MAG: right-handed parallel beta-helix repeat-containing protein, partial [Fuerstiella sp.]
GMAFGDFYGATLYGITDEGELITINKINGSATMVSDLGMTGFQGLSLGPQNVSAFDAAGNATTGRYANLLFALTGSGTLIAMDTTGALQSIFDSTGNGLADATSIDVEVTGATGLAFSPLDFNLWHPTTNRSANAGHGINLAFDNSRTPGAQNRTGAGLTDGQGNIDYDQDEGQGGTSLYFGLDTYTDDDSNPYYNYESPRGQLGIRNHDIQRDLTSNADIGNNYNLPGGALGSLVTAPFDLVSQIGIQSAADRPVLYFNYFLHSEDTSDDDPSIGGDGTGDGNARDTARVYVTKDDGVTWTLLATNNGDGAGGVRDDNSELPTYSSESRFADFADGRQATQELFDNTGDWRQARIDLSDYVGQTGLMLRFDFSTSGSMDDSTLLTGLGTPTDNYGEFYTEVGDKQPSDNNTGEGFYIDDLIVGWAERGEMITGAGSDQAPYAVPIDPDPDAPQQILSGDYQLEIRRGYEYAAVAVQTGPEIVISAAAVPDTNVQFVPGFDLLLPSLFIDFDTVPSGSPPFTPSLDPSDNAHWTILPGGGETDNGIGTNAPGTPGLIGPNEQATLTIIVTTGEGELTFDRFFVPESGKDTFQVFIDGTPIEAADFEYIGTDTGYVSTSISMTSGAHTVKFVHKKNSSGTRGVGTLSIDNIQFPKIGGFLRGDRNIRREQGLFEIASNIILDSSLYGIRVEAAGRDIGTTGAGSGTDISHPGAAIRFETPNSARLAPGAVIQNNIISRSGMAGIRFAGEPETAGVPLAAVPFGKIINNTIVGNTQSSGSALGIGVEIDDNASPTLLNNIIAETTTGILVDASSLSTVIGRTHFYRNSFDGAIGQNAILVSRADSSPPPLFIDASIDNYYLLGGSEAIDRSLGSLADRTAFVSVKTDLGIPPSDVFSPGRDLYGQLRRDDISQPASGLGGESFNDLGAVERADFIGPFATIVVPADNSLQDSDPADHDLSIEEPNFLTRFIIQIIDEGIGVDDTFVNTAQWQLERDGTVLVDGTDYFFIYNTATNQVIFQAISVFSTDSRYTITVVDRSSTSGIRDLAGNLLQANRADGAVRFEISLDDGENDAPVNVVPATVTTAEDTVFTFSSGTPETISVSDSDVHLGTNELTVTLLANHGTIPVITAGRMLGSLRFPAATTLVGQTFAIRDQRTGDTTTTFTFVSGAPSNSTEIEIDPANDDGTAVAAAVAATVTTALGGTTTAAVSAGDTVTLDTGVTAEGLFFRSSAITVAGARQITVPDAVTVVGSQLTINSPTLGSMIFTYVNSTGTVARNEIPVDASGGANAMTV